MHHMQKWIKDLNLKAKLIRYLEDIREMKTCMQVVHSCIHNMQKSRKNTHMHNQVDKQKITVYQHNDNIYPQKKKYHYMLQYGSSFNSLLWGRWQDRRKGHILYDSINMK